MFNQFISSFCYVIETCLCKLDNVSVVISRRYRDSFCLCYILLHLFYPILLKSGEVVPAVEDLPIVVRFHVLALLLLVFRDEEVCLWWCHIVSILLVVERVFAIVGIWLLQLAIVVGLYLLLVLFVCELFLEEC